MSNISKESLLNNLKQIFEQRKNELKLSLSKTALGEEHECPCGGSDPMDCDCDEVEENNDGVEPSELVKQRRRAERKNRAAKEESTSIDLPWKKTQQKPKTPKTPLDKTAERMKQKALASVRARAGGAYTTRKEEIEESDAFSHSKGLVTTTHSGKKHTLGYKPPENETPEEKEKRIKAQADMRARVKAAKNEEIEESKDPHEKAKIKHYDLSVKHLSLANKAHDAGDKELTKHHDAESNRHMDIVRHHHTLQKKAKADHVARVVAAHPKNEEIEEGHGVYKQHHSDEHDHIEHEHIKSFTNKKDAVAHSKKIDQGHLSHIVKKEKHKGEHHDYDDPMNEKVIPQPDKHTVQHNQGKGVHTQVSVHDTNDDAQAHIDKLKKSGDKRDLVIHKKKQFSKLVKEINEYKPPIVTQQEYEKMVPGHKNIHIYNMSQFHPKETLMKGYGISKDEWQRRYNSGHHAASMNKEDVNCDLEYKEKEDGAYDVAQAKKEESTQGNYHRSEIARLKKMLATTNAKGNKNTIKDTIGRHRGELAKMTEETLSEENGYIAFYKGRQLEIHANTSYEAQQKAAVIFKAKKRYDVSVHLAQKDGKDVVHTPTESVDEGIEDTDTDEKYGKLPKKKKNKPLLKKAKKDPFDGDHNRAKEYHNRYGHNEDYEFLPDDYIGEDAIETSIDEETGEEYFTQVDEETLSEARFIIRVNARGKRSRKLRCPKGKVVKSVNGRKVCMNQGGAAKLKKKLAIRKSLRTKRSKGTGAKKRANIKRQRALKRRHAMGL